MTEYRVFPVLTPTYSMTIEKDGRAFTLDDMSRDQTARRMRIARSHGYMITLARTWERTEIGHIPLCSGCRARMVDGEYDCDGWFWNVSCDSPQCDWWAAHKAREDAYDRDALADVSRFLA